MPNPNQLYEDMQKLDDLYNELMWHYDDELQFTHDGEKIIITNKTLEEKKMKDFFNEKAENLNGRLAMVGFIAGVGAYLTTGQLIPGLW